MDTIPSSTTSNSTSTATFARWLQRQWYRWTAWQLLLLPLAWIFAALSLLRRLGYRWGVVQAHALPVPVVVVGNISVGGTGKTPLVIWLVRQLERAGYRPGIISRGYGGSTTGPQAVLPAADPGEVGDEPVMLALRTQVPVWVGRDRVAAGQALLAAHPECDLIISDDGLQHYRLARTAEIVVIDGDRRLGNGQLLPAGPLREPPGRLARADAVVTNGEARAGEFAMQLVPGVFRNLRNGDRTATAADFNGLPVLAIAGIGHPERFFCQLRALGVQFEARAFPDHYPYRRDDLPSGIAGAILMTEKDAVKCRAFAEDNWWYLPVDARVDAALVTRLLNKLRK